MLRPSRPDLETSLPEIPHPTQQILGIHFHRGDLKSAVALAMQGGLTVAPSGPGLAELPSDHDYQTAITNADLALVDSGYLAILWRCLRWERVSRISGLRFLRAMLKEPRVRAAKRLWVVPGEFEGAAIRVWLNSQGLTTTPGPCYVAPRYSRRAIHDDELLARLENERPDIIIINIGGGVQEVLGYWLRERLSYRPSILCTGAAIGFLVGLQTRIPPWVDFLHLGWLWRIIEDPRNYGRRYYDAIKLWRLVWRYGWSAPPPNSQAEQTM